MEISPDKIVYWQWGVFSLNATIVFTWGVMLLLAVGSWLITRRLSPAEEMSRWQNLLEVIVEGMRGQIREATTHEPGRFLPFVGTLFLFIAFCNLFSIVPWYEPPTGSLSTTAALAICVFVAVPIFGIANQGLISYLKVYARPSVFMLPFNAIGEISRTLALAVRLFGNVMSGTMIVGILLAIAPFVVPGVMQVLGLLTGMIQAYIFAMLAMVYIASATRERTEEPDQKGEEANG